MEDFSREERGIFQGLKVPICLNAIILAFMAYVIFMAGTVLLSWGMHDDVAYEKVVLSLKDKVLKYLPALQRPVDEVIMPHAGANPEKLDRAYRKWYESRLGKDLNQPINPGDFYRPGWWQYLIFGAWFILLWSFFAGAINRTAAYRLARDESITLREGLVYGAQTWANHFLAIFFIALFIGIAYGFSVLASYILGWIPFAGDLLLIIAFIFIMVAAFLITLLLGGLLFGFNMISSAIGVDKVDAFDAISRSYSYVLSRPWQALLYTFFPLLFVMLFLYFGKVFIGITVSAVGAGFKNFGPIHDYIRGNAPIKEVFAGQPWTLLVCGFVMKIFLFLAQLFIVATAISYWLSARTKAYLLLRKEVDGDEVEEMYLEEEEEFAAGEAPTEALAPPAEPQKSEEKKYTEDSLRDLSIDELRGIGKKFNLTGRSKDKIIERILKAQEEK